MTDPILLLGIVEISVELAKLTAEGEKLVLIASGIFVILLILIFLAMRR